MYHQVTALKPTGYTVIEPEKFTRHLDAIKEAGYTTITVSEALSGRELPPRAVIITFDDGWADNVNAALELRKRGMSATFNIITGKFGHPEYVTREQVTWLAQHPTFEVGSHTHTHFIKWRQNLDGLTEHTVLSELLESREQLEELTRQPVFTLAWPYGYTTDTLERLATKAGYRSTQHVVNRIRSRPTTIERLNVDGRCTSADVLEMLSTLTHKECK